MPSWITATRDDVSYGLSPTSYAQIAAIARAAIGLELGEDGMALVWNRIRPRLAELGGLTFVDYLRCLADSLSERTTMVELLCTHETRFFREPEHFKCISNVLAAQWRRQATAGARPRRIRAWSAACSTGEEAFTLAMVLREALPHEDGWAIEVVATDVSRRVLAQAAEATWPIERAAAIPPEFLRRYMLRGFDEYVGTFRARPELRELVRFAQHNLLDHPSQALGTFDLVLCRNVLIYFQRREHAALIGRLLERVPDGGHLIVGHAESLLSVRRDLRGIEPTVYAYEPTRRRTASRRG